MTKYDAPAIVIALVGCMFILVAAFSPWLTTRFALRAMSAGERVLGFVLGAALLGLWAIWLNAA